MVYVNAVDLWNGGRIWALGHLGSVLTMILQLCRLILFSELSLLSVSWQWSSLRVSFLRESEWNRRGDFDHNGWI